MAEWHTVVEDRWRKFQFIADSSNDFMTLVNRDYIYEAANRSYLNTFKKTETGVLGRTVAEVWGQDVFERDIKPFLDTCLAGRPVHYQAWFEFHDLGRGYYDVSYYPYFDDQGRVSHAAVISHDVTAHKRTAEALAASEERYRTALDSNPDPMAALDMDGRVTYLNQAFETTFGWQPKECLGRDLTMILPPELKGEAEMVNAELTSGRGFSGLETIRLTKAGQEVPVSISGAAHLDSKGGQVGSIITWRDISGQKRLEAQLLHAQKMEAIGTLASGIAHEFNNILQTISGRIELIAQEAEVKPESLTEMDLSIKRAADLVKRLLSFGRKDGVDLRLVDLNHLVEQSVRIMERTLPKMISIQTDLSLDRLTLTGDDTKLEQVILNLATNAAEAMPKGGRLTLKTEEIKAPEGSGLGHKLALLTVTDTGTGMDEQTRARIFEPFFTTKETGRGSGLGLSVAYSIISDHGGNIDCASRPGQGSVFRVSLPLANIETRSKAAKAVPDESPASGPRTILLVDDEPPIINVTSAILEAKGFQVLSAFSGEEALETYKDPERKIDLVILDLGMPGMGGQACLEKMVAFNPDIPILIASGYSSAETVLQVTESGAAGFVGKPYRMAELLDQVVRALGGA